MSNKPTHYLLVRPRRSFWQKLRVNKIVMKNFSNLSFRVDVKLYMTPLKEKINTHNKSGERS